MKINLGVMKVFVVGVAVALAGCASGIDDMINNKFMEHIPERTPAGMTGDWTGVNGPYMISMQMGEDGVGLLCGAYSTNNSLQNIKYNGGVIYIQDGTRMNVALTAEGLTATPPYDFAKDIKLIKDSGFKQAAPFCKQNMPRGS